MTDRRSFLVGSSVLLASAGLAQTIAAFAQTPRKATFFSDSELRTLRVLVDLILPATDSPAASAADTHYFIDVALPACATAAAQKTFQSGVRALTSKHFDKLASDKQVALLKERAARDMELEYDQSFFKILKDYTLCGYFLSEIGATKALAYERVPGGFWGDLPLAPNQKAWAI
jgi:hypothetical protein